MSTETTSTLRVPAVGAPASSLAAFEPPRRAGRGRAAVMVTAAGLLVGGVVLAVAPPSWVQAALGGAPAVSGPDWAAHTQTQLASVDQQLSLIAQTRRNWQAVPAPLRARPPVALTRLEQRAAALEKDRETLARALAAYRDTARVEVAAAQTSAVTDTTPEQTTTAVDDVERVITQTAPPRQGPAVPAQTQPTGPVGEPSPSFGPPSIAPVPSAPLPGAPPAPAPVPAPGPKFEPAPAPPVPSVSVRPPSPPRGSSVAGGARTVPPRPTSMPPAPAHRADRARGTGDAPAHTPAPSSVPTARPSAHPAPPPAAAPSSGTATIAPGQGPYVVYLPPEAPQPQQQTQPAPRPQTSAPRPPAAQQPAPAAFPPAQSQAQSPSESRSRSRARSGSEDRAPFSKSEVEKYTGDRDIARESQTPEGQAILRQMFGGG